MEPYDRNLMLVQYLDALVPNMNIFEEMKQAGNGKFSYGTGSYLIDGKNYSYDNMTMDKQVLLFWAAKRAHKVLEIGTYLGHSLFIMLLANPMLHVTTIDCDDCARIEVLRKHFPRANIHFIRGYSLDVLPTLQDTFDLFHVDGEHTEEYVAKEFEHLRRLAKSDIMKVVFDDMDCIPKLLQHITLTYPVYKVLVSNSAHRNAYYHFYGESALSPGNPALP